MMFFSALFLVLLLMVLINIFSQFPAVICREELLNVG